MKKTLSKYPIISEEFKQFFLQKILDSIKDDGVPQEFKEHLIEVGVTNDMLQQYFNSNARLFFDFFDEKDLIILITNIQGDFSYEINGEPSCETFEDRLSAEKAAILDAVAYYNDSKNDNIISK